MTVIDIHPHIISDDADRYPPAPLFGKRSDWSQERPCTVASLIAAMDEAGVDYGVKAGEAQSRGDCENCVLIVIQSHECTPGPKGADQLKSGTNIMFHGR